jgi:alkanesulfonate monooxygenase SsuD/methylene tetrahydromethanopterin reductase-like flavin-dependent oxidoreductase (luciferase family)
MEVNDAIRHTAASYSADTDPTEELEHISERARLAAKCNFEALFVSQHYLTGPDTAAFQSLSLLAYLAGQVPGLYLGTSIFLVPLHPPVMVLGGAVMPNVVWNPTLAKSRDAV